MGNNELAPLPTANLLNEIKNRYINENLDGDPPELEELAEEYNFDLKFLRSVWSRQNWLALRNQRKETFLVYYNAEQERALQEAAVDAATIHAEYLRMSLNTVRNKLPILQAELERRITTMSDANLLTYTKMLIDLHQSAVKMVGDIVGKERDRQDRREERQEDRELLVALGLKTELIKMIGEKRYEKLGVETHKIIDAVETERESVFARLDSEIVGE